MKLADILYANDITWSSPPGNTTQRDFYETYIMMTPITQNHPPSLRNPKNVPVPTIQDGFHKKSSKKAKQRARKEFGEILRRTMRQIQKPVLVRVAQMPLYPDFSPERKW
ncbi:MAG: hypothetical protein KGL39_22165 [Patescibacteria group bacterium]|nr:hypothetical protein [Patescibacteria group bacterium]